MKEYRLNLPAARAVMIGLLLSAALILLPMAAVANDKMDAAQTVEKAQLTLQNFMADENMGAFRNLVQRAEGVLIVPSQLKGAYIFGISGGNGVLLVRDKGAGDWSNPAFYTVGGVSFGPQIGGQSSEIILLAMTQRGVQSLLTHSIKLGADASIALGPVGMGAEAATANLSADIISFSRTRGLYGGVSLDGALVVVRDDLNKAYYGKDVTPSDILVRSDVRTTQGDRLAEHVTQAARGQLAASRSPGLRES